MLIKIILQIIKNIFSNVEKSLFFKKTDFNYLFKKFKSTTFLILNPIDIFHSYRKTIKIKMI